MRKLKVGILGYGLSGRVFHGAIMSVLEGFEVSKIVTTSLDKRSQALIDFPKAKVVRASTEVFVDESIDLVVVATPNTKHAELAEAAMLSGKHVVIEKPFTVTTAEAERLITVAKETGKMLTVYHNRRFDSDFKTVKALLSSGRLGRVVEYEAHFDRFRQSFKENAWREKNLPGSGILYDLGAHLVDQALCLFGLPDEVYGDIRAQKQGETDDNFEVILYYPELKVTLKAGMLVKEASAHFTIYGTEGTFLKYGLDVQEDDLRTGKRPVDSSWGEEPKELWGILNTTENRQKVKSLKGDYRDFYQNIYDHIIEEKPLAITAEEAKDVIRIIECAIASNSEKKRIQL